MGPNHFQISWDSYLNNICDGFSQLQQREEFVDMTLAAEGHLVKVHRNLIALASPYLKEMLKSAPCQHPVIFLHNISHKVLGLILEYIYVGEVRVPNDMLDSFIKACKVLCINGAAHIDAYNALHCSKQKANRPTTNFRKEPTVPETNPDILLKSKNEVPEPTDNEPSNVAAHITIDSLNYKLEVQSQENDLNQDNRGANNNDRMNQNDINQAPVDPLIVRQSEDVNKNTPLDVPFIDTSTILDEETTSYDNQSSERPIEHDQTNMLQRNTNNIGWKKLATSDLTPQYSVSNRGCLQIILNRYIYYRHHVSKGGRKQRWRCINYRRMRCPAFIDSDGEILISRKGAHCHSFHDNIILKKINRSMVFSTIKNANQQAMIANKVIIDDSDDDMIIN